MTEQKAGARELIADYLFNQILGPTESALFVGKPLPDPSPNGKIEIRKEDLDTQYFDSQSGFPLIQNTRPEMIFGTGVLHSPENLDLLEINDVSVDEHNSADEPFEPPLVSDKNIVALDDPQEEQSSIDQSQRVRPSAMGFTSQLVPNENSILNFEITASTYETLQVNIVDLGSRRWYRRIPHRESISVEWQNLKKDENKLIKLSIPGVLGDYAELQIRFRKLNTSHVQESPIYALTSVVSHKGKMKDDLFQFELLLQIDSGKFTASNTFKNLSSSDLEEQEVDFLFRHVESFATGHGVSVNWKRDLDGRVNVIHSESIPKYFQEMVSTEISGLNLRMMSLSEDKAEVIKENLQRLVSGYQAWIDSNKDLIPSLPLEQQSVAIRLISKANNIAARMQDGLELLFSSNQAHLLESFRLMNRAMYLQQKHGKIKRREFKDKKGEKLAFDPIVYPAESEYGTWRPFQIGFLLLVIRGLVDPDHEDRNNVDLIFFPTGGGKTEAYLGASALLILFRRLSDSHHSGVDVLMRYTLRLLTVQQFERSAGLISALEHLRRREPEKLGSTPISIGVWLGDKTTPNRRAKAVTILESKGEAEDSSNPFVLSKCPWCGAAFALRESNKTWVGYKKSSVSPYTLRFICGDESCEFSRESKALPIWITDEDVYDQRPSFILGTVDKFAQISWESKSRAIFNLDSSGIRKGLPPGLIIQDELHLISGPLGSMVGLYETVIEEMCSYEKDGKKVRAKIIASTATTKKYESQIKNLYARERVTLFPQAVSRTNETYFSSVSRGEDGKASKGSLYIGINAATYSTGQLAASQVCAFLSQAPSAWTGEVEHIDYYSTSMWFFNSLKELGQTLTLMQSTVVSLLNQMWQDRRLPENKTRPLEPIMELTGRVSSAQVSRALTELNIPTGKKGSIRTCLASSIMEVGVDVQRLGLLTIMSQPKLTAQYIQVSGRVGRAGKYGPGLIIMLYNSNRARDRSVYENFKPFHEKLYAQVEPLSVTPFAIQTMDKGLWGAIIALYRMLIPESQSPTSLDESIFDSVCSVFRDRIKFLGRSEEQRSDFEKQAAKLKRIWLFYKPTNWIYEWRQEEGSDENMSTALLRRRSEPLTHIPGDMSFNIPQSMRSVDGQTDIYSAANVYSFLAQDGG